MYNLSRKNFRAVVLNLFWVVVNFGKCSIHLFFKTNMCRVSILFQAMAAVGTCCLDGLAWGNKAASLPDSPSRSHQGYSPLSCSWSQSVMEPRREDQRWLYCGSHAKHLELYLPKGFSCFILFSNGKSLKIRNFKQKSVTIRLTAFVWVKMFDIW